MDELVAWLREQLDADERIALAAPRGPWGMDGSGSITDADGARVVPSVGGARDGRATRWPDGPSADHILGHDPARVLREIDSKKHLVRKLSEADPEAGYITAEFTAWDALRLLALPYANRPGYREEWRP